MWQQISEKIGTVTVENFCNRVDTVASLTNCNWWINPSCFVIIIIFQHCSSYPEHHSCIVCNIKENDVVAMGVISSLPKTESKQGLDDDQVIEDTYNNAVNKKNINGNDVDDDNGLGEDKNNIFIEKGDDENVDYDVDDYDKDIEDMYDNTQNNQNRKQTMGNDGDNDYEKEEGEGKRKVTDYM